MVSNNETTLWTMRTVNIASRHYVEQTPHDEQSKVGLGHYIDNVDTLLRAIKGVPLVDPYGRPIDLQVYVERDIKHGVIDIGKRQQFGILSAGARVIPDNKTPDEIADILRNSHTLGNLFGQIADRPLGSFDLVKEKTNSELVVLDVMKDPDRYLDYTIPNNRVQFSQEGFERIRPLLRKGMGCPALKQVVQLPEGKAVLFAASWAANTEGFIHDYVLSGVPYTYEIDE